MDNYTILLDELIQDLEEGTITKEEYEKMLGDLKKHYDKD